MPYQNTTGNQDTEIKAAVDAASALDGKIADLVAIIEDLDRQLTDANARIRELESER